MDAESARLHASQPARPLVLSVTRLVRTNKDLILSEEKNKEDCCERLSSFVCVRKVPELGCGIC